MLMCATRATEDGLDEVDPEVLTGAESVVDFQCRAGDTAETTDRDKRRDEHGPGWHSV